MIAHVLRRLAWCAIVVWFVVTATFLAVAAIPGDPARAMVGPHADAATVERARSALCLDRPLLGQYRCHVGRLLAGDLGTSYRTRRPVARLVADKLWPTAQLALAAVLLQLVIGVPLGILAAARRRRGADAVAHGVALLGVSAPTFVLGPLLAYLLAYRTGLFPVSGYGEPGLDRLWHMVLPALTLAAAGIASVTLVLRGQLLEILSSDFIRTARAKGLPPARILLEHALPHAIRPVVILAGLDLGVLMGGAIITEYIFGWPGLGREAVLAVQNLDLPVILAIVTVSALAITLTNLLIDLGTGSGVSTSRDH